jgi:hypothetical protein
MTEPYGSRVAALVRLPALTVIGLLMLTACGGGAESPVNTVTVSSDAPASPDSPKPPETGPQSTPEPRPSRKRPTAAPITSPAKPCPPGGGDPVEAPCPSVDGRVPTASLTAPQPTEEPPTISPRPTSPSVDPQPPPPFPLQSG